jgi:hypothetical protein
MRDTSTDAYRLIKAKGLLSKLRFLVYETIVQHGPVSISEILQYAAQEKRNTGSLTGRISELERMGVIKDSYRGPCPVTGNNVIFWVATNELPVKLVKEVPLKEKLAKAFKAIDLTVLELEQMSCQECSTKLSRIRNMLSRTEEWR